jgi:mRNA interferase MazF
MISIPGGCVRRGEVWWAKVDSEFPIVLLSGGGSTEFRAVYIVAPATIAQRRGFVVLSPEVAANARERARAVVSAGPGVGGVGIEVPLGSGEGLDRAGVVRVALPQEDRIFCTWQLTVDRDALVKQVGTLSATKMGHLEIAVRLAQIE